MPVLTIDPDDFDAVMDLKRFVDPGGHVDQTVFAIGVTRYGQTIVDEDPGYLGARVTDRWGRTWERITNHDDPMWVVVDGHPEDLDDEFHSIQGEFGPLVAAPADLDPVPHPEDDA